MYVLSKKYRMGKFASDKQYVISLDVIYPLVHLHMSDISRNTFCITSKSSFTRIQYSQRSPVVGGFELEAIQQTVVEQYACIMNGINMSVVQNSDRIIQESDLYHMNLEDFGTHGPRDTSAL